MYVTCKTNCIYTVSFTCNIYFLNPTYFTFSQLRVTNFRVSFAVEYTKSLQHKQISVERKS